MKGERSDLWRWIAVSAVAFIFGAGVERGAGLLEEAAIEDRIAALRTDISEVAADVETLTGTLEDFTRMPRFGAFDGLQLIECVELNFQLHDLEARGLSVSASDHEAITECREQLSSLRQTMVDRLGR